LVRTQSGLESQASAAHLEDLRTEKELHRQLENVILLGRGLLERAGPVSPKPLSELD
jgi:hypothetical protein